MTQAVLTADSSCAAPTDTKRAGGFWPLIALLALVGAGKAIQSDTMDPDAFWHLRVADQLLTDGIGPLVDRLSFASLKTPWTPYSWLAELFMHAIWAVGEFRLATVVTAICSAGIIALIAAAARLHTKTANDLGVAILTAVAAFFTLPFVSFRPVTFGLLVMAAMVLMLTADRRRASAMVWWIVPLTVLLTNLHLYAVVIVALTWATFFGSIPSGRTAWRRLLWLAIATSIAACLTPMLRGAVTTAIQYNAVDPMVASPFITEMRPFYNGGTGKASLVLFIALMAMCVGRCRQLDLTDWLWLALGTVLLFRLGRFSPVFAMLATPAFARAFPVLGGRALGKPIVRIALWCVLAAGVINILPSLSETNFDRWLNRHNPTYPTSAAAYVDQHVTPTNGHIINEFNWGGYLSWRLGDRYQVLMDGRTQLYAPQFWLRTHLGDESTRLAIMKETPADAAVLPAKDSCFSKALISLGWTEAYRDDLAVVLVPPLH